MGLNNCLLNDDGTLKRSSASVNLLLTCRGVAIVFNCRKLERIKILADGRDFLYGAGWSSALHHTCYLILTSIKG